MISRKAQNIYLSATHKHLPNGSPSQALSKYIYRLSVTVNSKKVFTWR